MSPSIDKALTIELGWPPRQLSPNGRPNRYELARYKKAAKTTAYWLAKEQLPPCFKHNGLRMALTITAHPPTAHARDDDNLIASLKAHRDGIAMAMGCDDSLFDVQPVQWGETAPHGKVLVRLEAVS